MQSFGNKFQEYIKNNKGINYSSQNLNMKWSNQTNEYQVRLFVSVFQEQMPTSGIQNFKQFGEQLVAFLQMQAQNCNQVLGVFMKNTKPLQIKFQSDSMQSDTIVNSNAEQLQFYLQSESKLSYKKQIFAFKVNKGILKIMPYSLESFNNPSYLSFKNRKYFYLVKLSTPQLPKNHYLQNEKIKQKEENENEKESQQKTTKQQENTFYQRASNNLEKLRFQDRQQIPLKTPILKEQNNLSKPTPKQYLYALSFINMEIYSIADQTKTLERPYLIYLIPLAYCLAELLRLQTLMFKQFHQEKSYLKRFFDTCIKRINVLKHVEPIQFPVYQVNDALAYLAAYAFKTPQQIAVRLSEFVNKNQDKMKSFIPFYYYSFKLAAQKYQYFAEQENVNQELVREVLNTLRQAVADRYHNSDI